MRIAAFTTAALAATTLATSASATTAPAATTLATTAIVAQDQAALRAAPRDSAAQQAVLWQGDVLEVRGERFGYLQVYDHRRERAGYVLATQLRGTSLQPDEAPELLAVLRFVRDTPGAEALGIGYAAAYLKAAPAGTIGAEAFDALGTLAERLARRASIRQGKAGDAVAAHLEVASAYGVQFKSYERDGAIRLCYDGDAFRRVFSFAASAEQRARAALALTRHDCVDPALRPLERAQLDAWRGDVLDRIDAAQWQQLGEPMRNRVRARRAGVWSAIAFERSRQGNVAAAQVAAQRAIDELAAVDKAELSDDDAIAYHDAALRAGAMRWAAQAPIASAAPGGSAGSGGAAGPAGPGARLRIATAPGQPGETCVMLLDASHDATVPLARRCTYGLVWSASARAQPNGRALALAVQPLEGWRELWVFRAGKSGWQVDVLPPAACDPVLGYLEFAGWVPGGERMLVAREARIDGRFKRSFEIVKLATLEPERRSITPTSMALFAKWQDPQWQRATLSVR